MMSGRFTSAATEANRAGNASAFMAEGPEQIAAGEHEVAERHLSMCNANPPKLAPLQMPENDQASDHESDDLLGSGERFPVSSEASTVAAAAMASLGLRSESRSREVAAVAVPPQHRNAGARFLSTDQPRMEFAAQSGIPLEESEMRSLLLVAVPALVLAACQGAEQTAAGPVPNFAANGNVPDLDGLADLTVDAKRLGKSWLIRQEEASQCAVVEGGVSSGTHRVLRFTATTPNIGTADVLVGDPLEHVAADDGLFEFATCHDHFHFRNYATYELISVETGAVVQAAKRGFCMIDVTHAAGGPPGGKRLYDRCGNRTTPGFQGVSVGWADSYSRVLDGQYFVLDEPGATVGAGDYIVRITVNPPFVCGEGDAGRPLNADGFCHMFAESDFTNNVGEAGVTIPADVTRTSGPGLSDALSPDELTAIRTKTSH